MTIGEFSVVVSIAGTVPYIGQIVRGQVRPHRASWFVWTFILVLTLWGYRSAGAGDSAWFIAGDLLATAAVFVLSLWRGKGGFERFDVICLAVALAGLLAWQVSKAPLLILLGTMIADIMGTAMTVRGALRDPQSDSAVPFSFSSAAALCGLLAVGQWNMLLLFYPFYLFLANFVTASVVLTGQYQLAHLLPAKQPTVARAAK